MGADAGPGKDSGAVIGTDSGTDAGTSTELVCGNGFATEVFRDDFGGASIDLAKWNVAQQNVGGGTFTQLTKMLPANVTVSAGKLHVASHRHCIDPYPTISAANPAQCAGTNYYSGAWITGKTGFAAGKGLMRFLAKIPTAVQGTFPALWARNTQSNPNYAELDLIEQWWDGYTKGVVSDATRFSSTTWLGDGTVHTGSNYVGPVSDVNSGFHVYEVEWDGTAANATIAYYFRDTPTGTRTTLKTVDATSPGVSGNVSNAALKTMLGYGFRPYVDFAVQPDTSYHVSPNEAATYAPEDLEVDSIIICAP